MATYWNTGSGTVRIGSLRDRKGRSFALQPGMSENFSPVRWVGHVVADHRALLDRYVQNGQLSLEPPQKKRKKKEEKKKEAAEETKW